MYFRMNDRSSWCTPTCVSCGITIVLISVSPRRCSGDLLALPGLEVFRAMHRHCPLHAVMPQSAQLRARDLVIACFGCFEPDGDLHPGHSVLLEPEVGEEE